MQLVLAGARAAGVGATSVRTQSASQSRGQQRRTGSMVASCGLLHVVVVLSQCRDLAAAGAFGAGDTSQRTLDRLVQGDVRN